MYWFYDDEFFIVCVQYKYKLSSWNNKSILDFNIFSDRKIGTIEKYKLKIPSTYWKHRKKFKNGSF